MATPEIPGYQRSYLPLAWRRVLRWCGSDCGGFLLYESRKQLRCQSESLWFRSSLCGDSRRRPGHAETDWVFEVETYSVRGRVDSPDRLVVHCACTSWRC